MVKLLRLRVIGSALDLKKSKPYFDNINENNPDEAMIELDEVFHTD